MKISEIYSAAAIEILFSNGRYTKRKIRQVKKTNRTLQYKEKVVGMI